MRRSWRHWLLILFCGEALYATTVFLVETQLHRGEDAAVGAAFLVLAIVATLTATCMAWWRS